MSNRIPINATANNTAATVLSTLNQLHALRSQLERLHAIGEQAAAGGNFTAYNDLLIGAGMPEGTNVDTAYNLLSGLRSALNSADVSAALGRMATS